MSTRWNAPLFYRLPHTRNLNAMQTNRLLHFLLCAYAANEPTLKRSNQINFFELPRKHVVDVVPEFRCCGYKSHQKTKSSEKALMSELENI